jgi:diguanylate cyclase (GGDEF)-like protein
MTPLRVALYVGLAILGPLAWVVLITDGTADTVAESAVPVLVGAVLSLLLIWRLALMARLAQRKEAELASHTAHLHAAVAEQGRLRAELAYQATHDPLTGLANRTVLADQLDQALRAPTGRTPALMLLDLDGFKEANDTFGHPVGDELLVTASHRVTEAAPAAATVVRLGGDEFAILVDDCSEGDAMAAAERLRAGLAHPYQVGQAQVTLTASIGLLVMPPEGTRRSRPHALRDADLALYAAKHAGKNTAVLFHPGLNSGIAAPVRSA